MNKDLYIVLYTVHEVDFWQVFGTVNLCKMFIAQMREQHSDFILYQVYHMDKAMEMYDE